MDIPCILSNYYKGHVWSLNGEKYEGLVWIEENTLPKPTLEELTEKWNEYVAAQPLKELRTKRNTLLAKTDYVATIDYRQALRDLPSTTEDPANPVWPVPPE